MLGIVVWGRLLGDSSQAEYTIIYNEMLSIPTAIAMCKTILDYTVNHIYTHKKCFVNDYQPNNTMQS